LGIVTDRTNFSAEAGGQAADMGRIFLADNPSVRFTVADVRLYGPFVLHVGAAQGGDIKVR
jgi:alanyl-tRNA synthetase